MVGAVLVAGAATIVWLTAGDNNAGGKSDTTRKPVVVTVNDAPLKREAAGASFAPVVKKAAPSVVNIFTTKRVQAPAGMELRPFFDDPIFRRFFGVPFGDGQTFRPRPQMERSLGSGVIVSPDGYILTNNHVVDGADEIKVMLEKDRKEYTAKVVGRDPKSDIAVLKIEATGLPAITFGDSDKVEVGDVVLAIGNPFGVGQTVTSGIVSATRRGGMGIEDYEDFIQTDASINPGNSGGALVDAEGRLIGINTAILSRTGGNHGVGFAVPSNQARSIMDSLIKDGKVVRGFLGVAIQDLTADLAKEFNLKDAKGALVGEVTENSPAEAAGIKSGDVIIEFNGKPVADSRQLKLAVGSTPPGSKVDVRLLRDGKEKTVKVTLKQLDDKQVAAGKSRNRPDTDEVLKGVAVSDLNPAMRRQFNLPPNLRGALITEVDPDSASALAGLQPGMVIQEINHQPVANAEDAVRLTTNATDKKTLVKVWFNGGSRFIVVNEEKNS